MWRKLDDKKEFVTQYMQRIRRSWSVQWLELTTNVYEWFTTNTWKKIWKLRYIAHVTKVKDRNAASVYKSCHETFNNFFLFQVIMRMKGLIMMMVQVIIKLMMNSLFMEEMDYNVILVDMMIIIIIIFIVIWVNIGFGINGQLEDQQDLFYNDTCIVSRMP